MSRSVSIDEMASAIIEGLEEYADLSAQGVKSAVRKSAKASIRRLSMERTEGSQVMPASGADLAVAENDVFVGGEFLQSHRPAGVQPLRRDGHLGT